MTNSDLGIDRNGVHSMELTGKESICVRILQERGTGRRAAISATDLALQLFLDGEMGKRGLRTLINHLIMTHAIPIMCEAGPGGGYYLAGDSEETARFKETFRRRAMTGLVKASRGSKAAYVEMMYQYTLGFDDPKTQRVIERLRLLPEESSAPAWVQLVTKLLDRFSEDPQRYALEIRRIQTTYGDIFVPREKVSILKKKTEEFQKLLSEIA
jgi:hypothetical protein